MYQQKVEHLKEKMQIIKQEEKPSSWGLDLGSKIDKNNGYCKVVDQQSVVSFQVSAVNDSYPLKYSFNPNS